MAGKFDPGLAFYHYMEQTAPYATCVRAKIYKIVEDETVRRLARLLRELRPDIVLTHFPKEGDGMTNAHATAGQIVMHAIGLANSVDPGDRNPPHRVAQVFYFGGGGAGIPRQVGWDSEGGYYNDVFIDPSPMSRWRKSWRRWTAW